MVCSDILSVRRHRMCECVCRCRDCGAVLEEYDEETLALAVVVLSMFIHLSPDLAAPLLLEIMQSVGRYTVCPTRCVFLMVQGSEVQLRLSFIGWPLAPISPARLKGKVLSSD